MNVHIRFCADPTYGFRDQISSQIGPLTPTGRGPFWENFKNAITGLFPWSSCFTVPIFVHIGPAESE